MGIKTILDIGCGETTAIAPLRRLGVRSTGIDADLRSVEKARLLKCHDHVIHGDVRELSGQDTFDAVYCSHVIEHLSLDDGLALLEAIERIAKCIVYIETPNGFRPQSARDGNEFQRHLSGWFPYDFQRRGYRVYGSGIGLLRGVEGISTIRSERLTRSLERIAQNIVFRAPRFASSIGSLKITDLSGNIV